MFDKAHQKRNHWLGGILLVLLLALATQAGLLLRGPGTTAPAPLNSFDGIGFPGVACNCAPPDTNGAVGPNHYVQIVNTGYQVWDKSGVSLFGPVSISTIWAGFGGDCETRDDGDP